MLDHPHKTIVLALVLALLAAGALRISGVWFAYPLTIHPDERRVVETALGIKKTGDLNPHFFNYPSLPIYAQAGLFWAVDTTEQTFSGKLSHRTRRIHYFIAGRLLNVLLSLLTILVTFEIGRRLVSPAVGLAAALFISAAPLHVLNAFTATVDTPIAFWTSLSVLMAVVIATGGRSLRNYVLAGVFTGLAIGCKYTAFLAFVPLLLAHLRGCRSRRSFVTRDFVIALVLIPISFLATTPYAVLDHTTFLEAVQYEGQHYRNGHPGNEAAGSTSFGLYAEVLFGWGYGLAPMILALLGLGWLFRRDPWSAAILAGFPLLLFLFVGQYKAFFSRNLLACLPVLAVLSATGLKPLAKLADSALSRWTSIETGARNRIVAVLTIGLLIATLVGPTALAREETRKLNLPDSRWVSLRWIVDNIPDGAHLAREHYTPPIEHHGRRKGFEVTHLGYYFLSRPRAMERLDGVDYVILSSGDFQRFFDNPELYADEAGAYQRFFDSNTLVKEFVPDNTTLGGPHILIYSLPGVPSTGDRTSQAPAPSASFSIRP